MMIDHLQKIWSFLLPVLDNYRTAFVLALVAISASPAASRFYGLIARSMASLSRRCVLATIILFLFSLIFYAGWSKVVRMPYPMVHDEFSNLLSADTLLHGRLTNPTPVLWKHFETFHQVYQPTYASKYPPGEGLVLALGQKTTGLLIAGVWFSTALAVAAVFWALCVWLPTRWAMAGTLLVLFSPIVISWSQSYWGSQIAMLGGALVFGAGLRLIQRRNPWYAIVMVTGMFCLALSRPYEGAIFSFGVVLLLAIWMLRGGDGIQTPPARVFWLRMFTPSAATLLIAAILQGYYNHQVTHNVFQMPYTLHMANYQSAPIFIFQKAPTIKKHYDFPELAELHEDPNGLEMGVYNAQRTTKGKIFWFYRKLLMLSHDVFHRAPMSLGLLVIPFIMHRNRRARVMAAILFIFIVGMLMEVYIVVFVRYAGPAIVLLFALLMLGLRNLNTWRHSQGRIGQIIVRSVFALSMVCYIPGWLEIASVPADNFGHARMNLIARLDAQPGNHIVIVHYLPIHLPDHVGEEWVENGADIPSERIIWARDMGPDENQDLINAYPGRKVWLLTYGDRTESFEPYAPASVTTRRSWN